MKYSIELEGKKFNVIIDLDGIKKEIESLKNKYEEELYVSYFDCDYNYLTHDEYICNIDMFLKGLEIINNLEYCKKEIDSAKKKKNGMLYASRVYEVCSCDNCVYITDWHNTWIYHQLRFKSVSEDTLELELYEKVDTP